MLTDEPDGTVLVPAGSAPTSQRSTGWLSLMGRLSEPNAALTLMFAVGGLVGAMCVVLPHWQMEHPGRVLAVVTSAEVLAPVIWLARRYLQSWSRSVLAGIGTVAISCGVVFCGPLPVSMVPAYLYFWVVLYAAAFFRPAIAAAHLALVGLLYAAALMVHPVPEFFGEWMVAMSVLSITALTVGGFAVRLRQGTDSLRHQTLHDELTGLGNRSLFLRRVDRALRRVGPEERVAVLLLDLDDFRTVNDSIGHPAGDRLLVAVAARLAAITPAEDSLARLGGDEFAVLIEAGPLPTAAEQRAKHMAQVLEAPFRLGDSMVTVRASIGIAVAQPQGASSEQLLREADLAMYLAKQNGKSRFEMVRPGMEEDALKHLALRTDLQQALTRGEFEVFYQPIVRVNDTIPVGAEALIRWHHDQRGLVGPVEFIGVAETSGLIVPIGDWVLNQACKQAQAWRLGGTTDESFYISVNLAPRQLAEENIIADVARALELSGLPPSALVLEITESTLLLDFDTVLMRLRALKDLGVRLALDDYGTGYSSLSRLGLLPVDIVKIDKSFVDHVCRSPEDLALVRSVIDLCSALGMVSVAEGVELADQYIALEELGCDAIQGYLFAKPAPGAVIARTLLALASYGEPESVDPHPLEAGPASSLSARPEQPVPGS